MVKIVLNADDFGASERHTRLIIDLLLNGKISSTTFLVNYDYSPTAAEIVLRRHPELLRSIGLHFNLISGRPLNSRLSNSPLLDSDNNFRDFRRTPLWKQLLHAPKLRRELDMQIDRFVALFGADPSHIDSHGHMHCTVAVLLALLTSRRARRIGKVRLARQYDHDANAVGRSRLRKAATALFNAVLKSSFRTTDYFCDIRYLDGTWLSADDPLFSKYAAGSVEIMCHPYLTDDTEYDFLTSEPSWAAKVPAARLVSYTEV